MSGRPKGGYRLADGTKVPGTTDITGRFKDSGGLLQWAFAQGRDGAETLYEKRDEAADIGTFVHEMWEALLSGKRDPEWPHGFTGDMKDQAHRSIDSAIRWKEDSGLVITPFEEPLVSEIYHYGGVIDAFSLGYRGIGIDDWKSGRDIYLETWLQMAAYVNLARECRSQWNLGETMELTDGIHLVRFGKLGEFMHLHIPFDHPALLLAWEQFVALIGCYERDRQLRKMT